MGDKIVTTFSFRATPNPLKQKSYVFPTLDDYSRILLQVGWLRNLEQSDSVVRRARFESAATPLYLVISISNPFQDLAEFAFVQNWWRCVLAGGWAGYLLPQDAATIIADRVYEAGWLIEGALERHRKML